MHISFSNLISSLSWMPCCSLHSAISILDNPPVEDTTVVPPRRQKKRVIVCKAAIGNVRAMSTVLQHMLVTFWARVAVKPHGAKTIRCCEERARHRAPCRIDLHAAGHRRLGIVSKLAPCYNVST